MTPPDSSEAVCVRSDCAEARPRYRWYPAIKGAADFVLTLLIAVVALPIVVLAAIAVKFTSRGPAFYLQTRVGKNGRTYRIYKIRSMVHNAEARSGAVWSGANDPRITPVGKFLRDTHIDEFPQLLNVLLGQMSLIGPRPERPEFVDQLEWKLPRYRERLNVRPGITGLAQLTLPADTDLESVRRKLSVDLHYVVHCSPWLDFRITIHTAWLLAATCVRALFSCFSLPRPESVDVSEADVFQPKLHFALEHTQLSRVAQD